MNGIEAFVRVGMKESDRTLNEDMLRNVAHWMFAVIANLKPRRLVLPNGRLMLINYYGMTFARSNSGKSFTFRRAIKLLDSLKIEERYLDHLLIDADDEVKKLQRHLVPHMVMLKESTRQGLHKAAEAAMYASMYGASLNIYSEEMFADMNAPIMDALLQAYDGYIPRPTIKGGENDFDRYEDVNNLPVNFMGLSSLSQLFRRKNVSEFIGMLEGGWFRRAFVVNIETPVVSKDYESAIEEREIVKEKIEEMESNPELMITLNDEATRIFNSISKEMIDQSDIVQYGGLRDPYKMIALAAIYALSDGRAIIEAEDVMYAQQFEMRSFKAASRFCLMEHDFVRAAFELQHREMSENELVREGLLPRAKTPRDETIDDLAAYAIENSAQLTWRYVGRVQKYFIREYPPTDSSVSFSYAFWNGTKGGGTPMYDQTYEGEFFDIPDFIESSRSGIQLVAFKLRNMVTSGATNRTRDNVLYADMVLFDFDQGTPVEEVLDVFSGYNTIVRQSTGYTRETPKVHVYLKLSNRLHISHEEYKDFYQRIVKKFAIEDIVDMSMAKSVQPMYESKDRKHVVIEGKDFDPRCCLGNTYEAEHTDKVNSSLTEAEFKELRLRRYLDRMLEDLHKGKREVSINAFVHTAKTQIGVPGEEIEKALRIIENHVQFDNSFTREDMKKFYTRARA